MYGCLVQPQSGGLFSCSGSSDKRQKVTIFLKSQRPSHGDIACSKCQQWILSASRCGHGQKLILFLKKNKNATSDNLGMSNEAQLRKKGMFQIPGENLDGAKSGHMPWALCE